MQIPTWCNWIPGNLEAIHCINDLSQIASRISWFLPTKKKRKAHRKKSSDWIVVRSARWIWCWESSDWHSMRDYLIGKRRFQLLRSHMPHGHSKNNLSTLKYCLRNCCAVFMPRGSKLIKFCRDWNLAGLKQSSGVSFKRVAFTCFYYYHYCMPSSRLTY